MICSADNKEKPTKIREPNKHQLHFHFSKEKRGKLELSRGSSSNITS